MVRLRADRRWPPAPDCQWHTSASARLDETIGCMRRDGSELFPVPVTRKMGAPGVSVKQACAIGVVVLLGLAAVAERAEASCFNSGGFSGSACYGYPNP